MTRMNKHVIAHRCLALVSAVAILFGTFACEPSPTVTKTASPTPSNLGSVAIFTPSDGITISQHTPMNKWAKLVPELKNSLEEQGINDADITTSSSNDLADQSQAIQDYVVDTVTSGNEQQSTGTSNQRNLGRNTIVVAPVNPDGDATRQYGDYVNGTLSSKSSSDKTTTGGDADNASSNADVTRLAAALHLAKDEGMHVIVISNSVDGFTPDAFVSMSSAEQIGRIQAQELVSKLALAKAGEKNPKSIEVLLPYTPSQDDDSNDDASAESAISTDDASFLAEAFAGIWSILGPYYRSGAVISPSGKLGESSTSKSWRKVAVPVGQSASSDAKDALAARLPYDDNTKSPTAINGIIAMNDLVANGVTDELSTLGYQGSSADINPTISILGIVNNITGKFDITKSTVPDPSEKPSSGNASTGVPDDSDSVKELNSQWPIVTGFGAYVDVMPQIVDGKQWMTALENRKSLASDIAGLCITLNQGKSVAKLAHMDSTTVDGTKVATLSEPLLTVSASNLKDSLIDPGYVTLAQAGL